MGGGLLNLVAYGKKNVILNSDPSKTFFKTTYAKYSNFGLQKFRIDVEGQKKLQLCEKSTFKFKMPRYADLLMDTYFVITLPNIWSPIYCIRQDLSLNDISNCQPYEFKWVENIGTSLIHRVRFFLDDIFKKSLELTGKEKLNLRQLLKGIKFSLPAFKKGHYKKGFVHGREQVVPQYINIGIEALISIFGGLDSDFISVLKKITQNLKSKKKDDNDDNYKELSKYLLKKILTFDAKVERLEYLRKNYSMESKNGVIQKINSQDPEIGAGYQFFDILIVYVQKKLYQ